MPTTPSSGTHADQRDLQPVDSFPPPPEFARRAHIKSFDQYRQMYAASIDDPEAFWADIAAQNFHWQRPWSKARDFNFADHLQIKWFVGGQTNICYNCIDRHLPARANQPAIIWEGNQPNDDGVLTYAELHAQVCRFANALKAAGVQKGDRVSIYLPMIPELAIAVLACARIGAVHSVVFGGFSPESLANRIIDASCTVLITADGSFRGTKLIELKKNADQAMELTAERGVHIETCFVVQHLTGSVAGPPTQGNTRVPPASGSADILSAQGSADFSPARPGVTKPPASRIPSGASLPPLNLTPNRDILWHEAVAAASPTCDPVWMDSEDSLFILYTSGSTGRPKGVLHTVGGYMVHVATTFKYIFDYHDGDMWWCTADIGWVTGHSYIIYGPLCNGATTIMFEGIPTYPDASRFWDVVDKYQVTQFYTAPTAIRALMREGDAPVRARSRASLRLLGTVGEPINPEAWLWYHRVVGDGRCPVVDTWWQTETGGILISRIPGAIPTKPGSATLPFFGVKPIMVDPQTGKPIGGPGEGVLCFAEPWPGMMRTVYGDHDRFQQTYFTAYANMYFTGDGCRRDADGYWWITGRVDDVLNVSGHRLGTAEIESALVSHPAVAEAAVCGFPHNIKGQGIYAYVTLKTGHNYTDELKRELTQHVRREIGALATPDVIHWAPGLPKTRSGKIMRRILRKIAELGPAGTPAEEILHQIGDTSTLAEPGVVDDLLRRS